MGVFIDCTKAFGKVQRKEFFKFLGKLDLHVKDM